MLSQRLEESEIIRASNGDCQGPGLRGESGGVVWAFVFLRLAAGAVTLIGVLLAGLALASLVVDHFGMVGFDEHPATAGRVLGILLIACGVLFVRLF